MAVPSRELLPIHLIKPALAENPSLKARYEMARAEKLTALLITVGSVIWAARSLFSKRPVREKAINTLTGAASVAAGKFIYRKASQESREIAIQAVNLYQRG